MALSKPMHLLSLYIYSLAGQKLRKTILGANDKEVPGGAQKNDNTDINYIIIILCKIASFVANKNYFS